MRQLTWVFKLAWWDSRESRWRLLLFISSIVVGIGALVAISSFTESLEKEVHRQAKPLLGADIRFKSRRPFSDSVIAALSVLGSEHADGVYFSSMVLFPKNQSTRIVQVRAMNGEFPFYGEVKTEPPRAARDYLSGPNALVDRNLMLQYGVEVGDRIQVGSFSFVIVGALLEIPGETGAISLIGPRVYIPRSFVEQTDLLKKGSRVIHNRFVRYEDDSVVQGDLDQLKDLLNEHHVEAITVDEQKRHLGSITENLAKFLNLVGFIALFLGCLGVASAMHIYARQKRKFAATLRCLGASPGGMFSVFLIQSFAVGLLGAFLGAAFGVGFQALLPWVLVDFLPVDLSFSLSISSIAKGVATGLSIAMLFTLLSLLPIRLVSPLLVLRESSEDLERVVRDPWRYFIFSLLVASVFFFSVMHSGDPKLGVGYALGLVASFLLLLSVAQLLMFLTRRYVSNSLPYVWRQGLLNLYRPNNQTSVMILSLGFSTLLLLMVYFSQQLLLEQASFSKNATGPNMVLFDIQADQKDGVSELLRSFDLPVLQEVPIVTMRLKSVKGVSVQELKEKLPKDGPRWIYTREYRSTYRGELSDAEEILVGSFSSIHKDEIAPVPISLEKGIASHLSVSLGDELVFDVQGVPLVTAVTSIRKVDWQRVQPNFFVLFPKGVLEAAPQFYVTATRAETDSTSAALQRAAVKKFPNVSVIDLSLVVNTLSSVLDKISFVVRFMALLSILTGIIVVIGALAASRYERLRESVLLRVLGASRGQIRSIIVIEYLLLGGIATLAGAILSALFATVFAHFVFESVFVPSLLPLLTAVLGLASLTAFIGVLNSRGLGNHSPLELLRNS